MAEAIIATTTTRAAVGGPAVEVVQAARDSGGVSTTVGFGGGDCGVEMQGRHIKGEAVAGLKVSGGGGGESAGATVGEATTEAVAEVTVENLVVVLHLFVWWKSNFHDPHHCGFYGGDFWRGSRGRCILLNHPWQPTADGRGWRATGAREKQNWL